jgi:hypothetical protein
MSPLVATQDLTLHRKVGTAANPDGTETDLTEPLHLKAGDTVPVDELPQYQQDAIKEEGSNLHGLVKEMSDQEIADLKAQQEDDTVTVTEEKAGPIEPDPGPSVKKTQAEKAQVQKKEEK